MASSDGGATWKAARRLTQTAGVSRRPAVAAEGSKVYIVWEEETARDFDVYFKKSEDGGTTWQSAKRIVTSTLNDANPRIAVKGSNLYVVIQG
jgi:Neuraminidase (sialidase)